MTRLLLALVDFAGEERDIGAEGRENEKEERHGSMTGFTVPAVFSVVGQSNAWNGV